MKNLKLLKLFLVTGGLFYLYKKSKLEGRSLSGQVNPEAFVNLGLEFMPPEYRGYAKMAGHRLMKKIME